MGEGLNIILPIILSIIISVGYGYIVDNELAGDLTTVFAFVFTVLFGFAAILVGKIDSKNAIERQVVEETFISIMTSNILSLLSAVISIIIIMTEDKIKSIVLSTIIYCLSFMIIMLLLMISKRTFVIYCSNKTESL